MYVCMYVYIYIYIYIINIKYIYIYMCVYTLLMQVYKCDNPRCPRPDCYRSDSSSRPDVMKCTRPGCKVRNETIAYYTE